MTQIALDLTKNLAPPRDAAAPVDVREDNGEFAEKLQDAAADQASDPVVGEVEAEAPPVENQAAGDAEAAAAEASDGGESTGESADRAEATDEQEPADINGEVEAPIGVVAPVPVVSTEEQPLTADDGEAVETLATIESANDAGDGEQERPAGSDAAGFLPASETTTQGKTDGEYRTFDPRLATDAATEGEASQATPVDGDQPLPQELQPAAIDSPPENLLTAPPAPIDNAAIEGAETELAENNAPPPAAAASADSSAGEQQPNEGEQTRREPSRDQAAAPAEALAAPLEASATEPPPSADAAEPSVEARGETSSPPIERNESSVSPALSRIAAGRLGQQAGAESAENSGPRVDAARFVSRVSGAFQAAQERGGEVRLRLSPPELGVLQIKLTVAEGVLNASLETENAAARNAILDNLPALRERLAEQEIRVEKFDVDVRDERGGGDAQDWAPGERRGNEQRNRNPQNTAGEPTTARSDPNATAQQTTTTDGRINLVA